MRKHHTKRKSRQVKSSQGTRGHLEGNLIYRSTIIPQLDPNLNRGQREPDPTQLDAAAAEEQINTTRMVNWSLHIGHGRRPPGAQPTGAATVSQWMDGGMADTACYSTDRKFDPRCFFSPGRGTPASEVPWYIVPVSGYWHLIVLEEGRCVTGTVHGGPPVHRHSFL